MLEHSDRVGLHPAGRRAAPGSGWIASHYLSYVRDNALWIPSGPIDGGRFALTAGRLAATSPTAGSTATSSRATGASISGWASAARGRSAPTASTAAATARGGSTSAAPSASAAIPQFGYIVGSRSLHVQPGAALPAADPPHPRHPVRRRRLSRDSGRPLHRCRQGHASRPPPTARCSAAMALASAWRWAPWPCSGSTSAAGSATTDYRGLRPELRPEETRVRQLLLRL